MDLIFILTFLLFYSSNMAASNTLLEKGSWLPEGHSLGDLGGRTPLGTPLPPFHWHKSSMFRNGPLEKWWGEWGIFSLHCRRSSTCTLHRVLFVKKELLIIIEPRSHIMYASSHTCFSIKPFLYFLSTILWNFFLRAQSAVSSNHRYSVLQVWIDLRHQ